MLNIFVMHRNSERNIYTYTFCDFFFIFLKFSINNNQNDLIRMNHELFQIHSEEKMWSLWLD